AVEVEDRPVRAGSGRLHPLARHAARIHPRRADAIGQGGRRRQLLHALAPGRSVHVLWHRRRGAQHVDEDRELRAGHGGGVAADQQPRNPDQPFPVDSSAIDPVNPPAMRTPWPKLALALSLTVLALASRAARAATTIQAQGGIRLVAVTSSVSGALLTLEDRRGHQGAPGTTDRFGSLLFTELDPGNGYVVRDQASGDTVPVTVLSFKDLPDPSFYTRQTLHDGLNYIQARDGTLLAAMGRAPLGQSLATGP